MLDATEVSQLRQEVQAEIDGSATNEGLVEWMDTYAFHRADLFEVVRLLLKELADAKPK